jgi:hypothetical protein
MRPQWSLDQNRKSGALQKPLAGSARSHHKQSEAWVSSRSGLNDTINGELGSVTNVEEFDNLPISTFLPKKDGEFETALIESRGLASSMKNP